jgi:hypothetical protein
LNHHYNLETQCFLKLQNISQLFLFSAGAKLLRVVQLESMPGYKYPNIDSGLLPSGALAVHPIERQFQEIRQEEIKKKKLEPMIDYKYPTIASGATPIGSAGRAPDEKLFREE